jgi:hypothetical protein
MIRYILAAALALLATPAVADTVPIHPGTLTVHQGDTLVTSKPLVETVQADGTLTQRSPIGWIDRTTGKPFSLSTGTRLKVLTKPNVGYSFNGFTYQVVDGVPAAPDSPPVTVPVTPQPPVATGIAAHVSNPFGINLAGCAVAASLCPNDDDINWYTAPAQGFEMFRLAFHDTTDQNAVRKAGDGLLAKGATVMFDRHDYKWPSVADQVAFWTSFGAKYKTNTKVIFDLMNEPRGFDDPVVTNDWTQWAADTKAIIAGLRAAGFQNTIAVEWPGSSAAFRFDKNEPAYKACESAACAVDRQGGLGDSNVIFSAHQYWDHGSSGSSPNCDPYFFLDTIRAAAAKRGWKLELGEGAFGSYLKVRDTCQPLLNQAIPEIRDHPDTWFGVTWWGGGREWKESYIFKIEPTKGTRALVPHSAYLDKLRGQ